MTPGAYIDVLLRKYQQVPSFPFNDWASNPVSFYALMNLWDDLFKTAVGSTVDGFVAACDVRKDPESRIYEVMNTDLGLKVNVKHEDLGGTFYLYSTHSSEARSLQTYLGFATDIERGRLIAAFEILREVSKQMPKSVREAEALQDRLTQTYRSVYFFPDFDPFEGPDETEDEG